MAIKYPDRIESNNPLAYGIVKATEIAGQRLVKQLSDLYNLSDAILSESKTGEDAEGLIWIVGKDLYQLISWLNRNNASGWLKVIPFNEKMFDRLYNLDGNMINSLTGYTKATELLNLLENDSLLNALGKLEYKADLTYDLVNSVYEGVHTIEELREMLRILEEIQNSSELLNSYLSKYLPLSGGTMSGSIDMNKFSLKTAGFETVTALPTTNLFVGRKVVMNGIEYTYNGNLWTSQLDPLQKYTNNLNITTTPLTTLNAKSYELQLENGITSQIPNLLATNSISLTDNVLQSNEYIYERMDNGTTEWVETTNKLLYLGDKLRFTAWKDWENNVMGLANKAKAITNENSQRIESIYIPINSRNYKMKVSIEYLTYINNTGDSDTNNSANYAWYKIYEKEFPAQKTTWIFPLQHMLSIYSSTYYIQNIRITIESITAGTTSLNHFQPSVNIYTSYKITFQNTPININYNAKIKPTQTTTTYNTNSWILQYLTQGVHWLRDNKVETNSDATLKTLNITGPTANSTAKLTATANYEMCVQVNNTIPFVAAQSLVCPGREQSNKVDLGTDIAYWKSVRAGKYIVHGGTSSQFLKADGSLDSNTYATLNEDGQVEKSILSDDLGGREETRNEQFTYQATADDESIKDGLAIVKSIKGNTVVANQLFKENIKNPNKTIDVSYNNGVFTINGSINATNSIYLDQDYTQYKQGDKVLLLYPHNKPNPYGYFVTLRSGSTFYHCPNNVDAYIVTITETEELRPEFICIVNKLYEDVQFSLKIINLTKMFNAGKEPTIEEFERLYPNLPTAYNIGSLLNLNADSIKSVGFNAFNGNYAQVLGGQTYYLNGEYTSLGFKENEASEVVAFELPTDRLYTPQANGYLVAEGSDICINLSHSGYRNGEYEPYKESIVNLPIQAYFPDGMKSAGAIKDEIVWDEGLKKYKAIQRVGSEYLGNLEFRVNSVGKFYTVIGNKKEGVVDKIDLLCSKYISKPTPQYGSLSYDGMGPYIWSEKNTISIFIQDDNFTDPQILRESLAGQILYYELETPIETIIDDYDLIDYEVSDFGTEEILSNEPTTPIIADIQYGFNAVDEIRDHRFEIKRLNKKINELTALVESLLATLDVNYEELN